MKQFIYKFEAMSTDCELILFSKSKAQADKAAKSVLLEEKRLEKKYNYFDNNSFLSQLNTRATDLLDMESKNLLERVKKYYKLTEGLFDITVATFKPLYTQNLSTKELMKRKEELLPFVGCEHFSLKKGKLIFDNSFTMIDLGGFVKEYSVDRAVKILQKEKIKSALINFGGDIYALGKKPNGEKFRVGIKNPHNPSENVKSVQIEDEALTTSASYERNYQVGDKTFSHIFSKKEGVNQVLSVTVISSNCVESGVYSTALMINPNLKTSHKTIPL